MNAERPCTGVALTTGREGRHKKTHFFVGGAHRSFAEPVRRRFAIAAGARL
jgi:hypothetical protein